MPTDYVTDLVTQSSQGVLSKIKGMSFARATTATADKRQHDSRLSVDYYHDTGSSGSSYGQDASQPSPSFSHEQVTRKKTLWQKLYRSRTSSATDFPADAGKAAIPNGRSARGTSFTAGDPAHRMMSMTVEDLPPPAARSKYFGVRRHSQAIVRPPPEVCYDAPPVELVQAAPARRLSVRSMSTPTHQPGLQHGTQRVNSDIIGTSGDGRTPSGNGNTASPYSTLTTDEESHSSFPAGSQSGKHHNSSPTPTPPNESFANTSNKAWQIQYLQNSAEAGADVPLQCGVAGHWRKNVDDSDTGAVFEELLDMPRLQRLARQRTHALEIRETAEHIELLFRVRLNGGREIVKSEKYAKDGTIGEGTRRDGREGQMRGFASFKEGTINIRSVQGDPYAALFHDKLRVSTRGNRLKIEHKLQLLIHGVQPVKYTTIWNRLKEDDASSVADRKLSSHGSFDRRSNS